LFLSPSTEAWADAGQAATFRLRELALRGPDRL